MKFLDTEGTMKIVENDIFSECVICIPDEMLDLSLSDFIEDLTLEIKSHCYINDYPALFNIKCDDMDETDIEYIKNLVCEIIADALSKEQINKDWQPRLELNEQLDMNMKAKTSLLNHKIEPRIFNIIFTKESEVLYSIIK